MKFVYAASLPPKLFLTWTYVNLFLSEVTHGSLTWRKTSWSLPSLTFKVKDIFTCVVAFEVFFSEASKKGHPIISSKRIFWALDCEFQRLLCVFQIFLLKDWLDCHSSVLLLKPAISGCDGEPGICQFLLSIRTFLTCLKFKKALLCAFVQNCFFFKDY